MINGLGMKDINFIQIDAVDYDYSEVDVVFIPLFVTKKDEVIEQIEKT